MKALGFTEEDQELCLTTAAGILHLCSVEFEPVGESQCTIDRNHMQCKQRLSALS